ncbi:LPXTG cell wall anchor domain-containing protein [Streptomyces gilvosporeus]|uniref:Gram-positive cocci surface proteins LPxTG domain-containing protein n=1 Tax=Streptomyces gilvosporeus TaxID=553510 RepID=A0A1V0U181_9ACTN|nr:LPXTG cell wall anchor domain-containing protein [Streptomyces gilvosporeus]ARF58788.1 hypothetical protein B1H19_35530 [Streptomyces gilvosporeus]
MESIPADPSSGCRQCINFPTNEGSWWRWPLRGKNAKWTKYDTYQRYLKSFREGDYTFTDEVGGVHYSYSVGGVDFSKAPKHNITKARFTVQHPRRDKTTSTSRQTEVTYRNTSTSYLGGGGATLDNGGDGKPTPTPTPSTPGHPSTPPGSHTPTPGTPAPTGGGDHGKPAGPGKGGDLAHTGSDTPIGLLIGLAAALAAAGGALMWWMRRRRSARP